MNARHHTLITGASSGIGLALAEECARRSMRLVLVALPGTGLTGVARSLRRRLGTDVVSYEGDLTDMSFIHSFFSDLEAKGIRISVLINNAGMGYEGRFDDLAVGFCNTLMQLNMQSLVVLTRLALEHMKSLEKGYILNVSSLASFTPMPYKCMYAATKSFVYSFSRALRAELKDTSVSVSVLCPGAVATNDRTRESIRRHGFLAQCSALTPRAVAAKAVAQLLRRKEVIVPGRWNKLSRVMMKFVPCFLQLLLLAARYKKTLFAAPVAA